MPGADPNLIRQAVAQFQPRRRPRFQNLQACREVIIELREKGASCEAIAELLTRYGVKTSRTMVNEFVLTLRRPKGGRQRIPHSDSATRPASPTLAIPNPVAADTGQAKTRGPHIAKVELLKPGEKYD